MNVCDLIALAMVWGEMEVVHNVFFKALKERRECFTKHEPGSMTENFGKASGESEENNAGSEDVPMSGDTNKKEGKSSNDEGDNGNDNDESEL